MQLCSSFFSLRQHKISYPVINMCRFYKTIAASQVSLLTHNLLVMRCVKLLFGQLLYWLNLLNS